MDHFGHFHRVPLGARVWSNAHAVIGMNLSGELEGARMLAKKREELPMEHAVEPLESRVARLEGDVAHIGSNVSKIEFELRDFRKTVDAKFEAVNAKFDVVNAKFDAVNRRLDEVNGRMLEKFAEQKVWALIVVGGGVLSIVARALRWF